MSEGKKKKIIIVAVVVLFIFYMLSNRKPSLSGKPVFESHAENNANINYIDGVSFDVPSAITQNATTVQSLDGDAQQYTDGAWILKQDNSLYMMFHDGDLYIIASKGKIFSLGDNAWDSIEGTAITTGGEDWFKRYDKSDYASGKSNGATKYVFPVQGNIQVNPQVFGDFVGKLAVLERDGEQWCLFAGGYGTDWASLNPSVQGFISHTVASLQYTGEHSEDPEESSSDIQTETPTASGTVVPSGTTEIPLTEDSAATDGAVISTESAISSGGAAVIPKTEEATKPSIEGIVITDNNAQNDPTIDYQTVNDTLITSPVGTRQKAKIRQETANGTVDSWLRIDAVLTDEQARQVIEKYAADSGMSVPQAAKGTSFLVLQYSIGADNGDSIIPMCIYAPDGGPIAINGVEFDDKMKNIYIYKTKMADGYGNLFAYYEFPNGLTEALIKGGTDECPAYISIKKGVTNE